MGKPAPAPTTDVYRGDYTVFPSAQFNNADGTPKDVSTFTWLCQWRLTEDSTTFLELDVDISNADNGWIYISASGDITAQMTGPGIWDLQAILPDAKPVTKLRGKTKLIKDVSRV